MTDIRQYFLSCVVHLCDLHADHQRLCTCRQCRRPAPPHVHGHDGVTSAGCAVGHHDRRRRCCDAVQLRVQLLKSSVAECSILIAASSSNWPTLIIISAVLLRTTSQFCYEQRARWWAHSWDALVVKVEQRHIDVRQARQAIVVSDARSFFCSCWPLAVHSNNCANRYVARPLGQKHI